MKWKEEMNEEYSEWTIETKAETTKNKKRQTSFPQSRHKHNEYLLYIYCTQAVCSVYIFEHINTKFSSYG